MPGRLIVLEGADGSGKSTQLARLETRLMLESIPFRKVRFPRYEAKSSALVRMYLNGEFSDNPDGVNAYAASAFYAVDRCASFLTDDWGTWYRQGGLVIADRYTTSNAVHQAVKLPKEDREGFFRWLYDFEFDRLALPRPDLVFYLDMPESVANALLASRQAATHTQADLHERDAAYLHLCRQAGIRAAETLGWQVIRCATEGAPRSVESIHQEIWKKIVPILE